MVGLSEQPEGNKQVLWKDQKDSIQAIISTRIRYADIVNCLVLWFDAIEWWSHISMVRCAGMWWKEFRAHVFIYQNAPKRVTITN